MPNRSEKSSLLLIVLFSLLIVSCTAPASDMPADEPPEPSPAAEEKQAPASAERMLMPGDMIGEMVITQAGEWSWDTNFYELCEKYGNRVEDRSQDGFVISEDSCQLVPGTEIQLTCGGVYADESLGEDLDTEWSEFEPSMMIDGLEVDLSAFGWMDFESENQVRTHNVQLENLTPGMHTIFCSNAYDGEDTYETTYYIDVSERHVLELPPGADTLLYHGESDKFNSLTEFYELLNKSVENGQLYAIWNPVKAAETMPLIFDDYAVFLYRGDGENVLWQGKYLTEAYARMGTSNLWVMMREFETDATIDYKISVDGEEILDPLNPVTQQGFYPISVLRMPAYVYPEETVYREDIEHGDLTDNILISSEHLGYDKFYRVYTPPGIEDMESLPVIYVTDGTDAINEAYLGMVNVLDNLIAAGRIEPIIAVFIGPHNAATDEYVRRIELVPNDMDSCPFCDFVVEELVPQIDATYKTDPSPDARALFGTSLGGQWASYMGLAHNDLFHLIGIQSHPPPENHWILKAYQQYGKLPISVFLHHGTYDTGSAPRLAEILQEKDIPLHYIKNNGGHSHGSWRGTTDDMLVYFFGKA